jgi:hypothetical protein
VRFGQEGAARPILRQDLADLQWRRGGQRYAFVQTRIAQTYDFRSFGRLARLVRETDTARQAVLHAVNPDAPGSAMGIMKQTLTTLLTEHSRSQAELLKAQQERQERFEKEVREALVRLESRRAQERLSPRAGFEFEDTVVEFIARAVRGAPCIVEATGNTPGLRTRCKKGDLVVRPASLAPRDGLAKGPPRVRSKHPRSTGPG